MWFDLIWLTAVFKRRYLIPRETLSAGALNTRGWVKFAIFWLKSPFISQTLRDRLMQFIDGGSIRVGTDDLEWPWKAGCEESIFLRRISLITLVPFEVERPNSTGWHVGRGVFLEGQPRSYRKGRGPALPSFWCSVLFVHTHTHTPFDTELPNFTR